MVNGIANLVLRFKRREKLSELVKKSKKNSPSFKTLLIIIPEEVKLDEQLLFDFALNYKILLENITVVVVSKKEIEMPELKIKNRFNFSRTKIGFWGSIPNEWQPLFNKSYDLLLNFFNQSSVFIELVSASFNAQYRMGFSTVDSRLNDILFTLETSDNHQFLSECSIYVNALIKTKK